MDLRDPLIEASAMQRQAMQRAIPEPRRVFNLCPACDGEGRWESAPWGVDYRDGSVLCSEIVCDYCGGEGDVEEDAVLIEEDDLDEIEAAS
jgi:hypothetical protein